LPKIIFSRPISQIAYVNVHRILLSAVRKNFGILPFDGKKKQPTNAQYEGGHLSFRVIEQ